VRDKLGYRTTIGRACLLITTTERNLQESLESRRSQLKGAPKYCATTRLADNHPGSPTPPTQTFSVSWRKNGKNEPCLWGGENWWLKPVTPSKAGRRFTTSLADGNKS